MILAVKETQIKPTMGYHFMSVRAAINKRTKINAGEDVRKKKLIHHW